MTNAQITNLRLMAWVLLALNVFRIVVNVIMGDWWTLIDCVTIALVSAVILVSVKR